MNDSRLGELRVVHWLQRDRNGAVYRAFAEELEQTVIVKQVDRQQAPADALVRLQHEYDVLSQLDVAGVIRPIALVEQEGGPAIVFPDHPAQPLRELLAGGPLPWPQAVGIAIELARLLERLHQARVIHKQITPDHILIGAADGLPTLIDFSLSTRLLREQAGWNTPQLASRSLPYIAPEQSGRVNRAIDYRSDYYSLGATLHELLTGRPPFADEHNLELVHCHIAKPVRAPHLVDERIPEALSAIVLKLLAKDPDERYQSAYGLIRDLARCLRLQRRLGHVPQFAVGRHDVPAAFHIPQRLYGREQVLSSLRQACERTALGGQELILISGYTGVGKSALAHEMRQGLYAQGGRFGAGKFDQYQQGRPYSAVLQALHSLVRELLAEPEARIQVWRQRLREGLGKHLPQMLRMLPEIELITGPADKNGPVGLDEHNRLHIFARFLRVLAGRNQPLVLFLDDLQWADRASLDLLEAFARTPSVPHLLLIGSYRHNHLTADHPLYNTLTRLRKSALPCTEHRLAPLSVGDVRRMLADMLYRPEAECERLAALCHQKVQGNPFFLVQFLRTVHEEGGLFFRGRAWYWDEALIEAQDVVDDVVHLMIERIRRLPTETQHVLAIAACMGTSFELLMLARVAGERVEAGLRHVMWPALAANLIVPLEDGYPPLAQTDGAGRPLRYRFVHDRIQQAAYSLLDNAARNDIHLRVGRLLLAELQMDAPDRRVFETAAHLNRARNLIRTTEERLAVATLNLKAGTRARESAAFDSALDYFRCALDLLPVDAWKTQLRLALDVHLACAEAASLKSDFALMDRLLDNAAEQVDNVFDRVRIYEIRMQANIARSQFKEGLDNARQALALLGIELPAQAGRLRTRFAVWRTRALLRWRPPENLLARPPMRDPRRLAALSVLSRMFGIVKFSSSSLRPLVMAHEVALIARHGMTESAGPALAGYGSVLCAEYGLIEEGFRLGELGERMAQQVPGRPVLHKTQTLFNSYVRHYREPLALCRDALLESFRLAQDCGDMEYAAYSLAACIQYSFPLAQDYAELQRRLEQYVGALEQTGQRQSLQYTLMALQAVANLRGLTQEPCVLDGSFYREQAMLASHIAENHRTAICVHYSYKALLCFVLGDYDAAWQACQAGLPHVAHIAGTHSVAWFEALEALVLFEMLARGQVPYRRTLRQLRRTLERCAHWTRFCGANHGHRLALLQAEWHNLHRRREAAMSSYDRAIALAARHGFAFDAGLACERAARFFLNWGKPQLARAYLEEACQRFRALGAEAVLHRLRRDYSDYVPVEAPPSLPERSAGAGNSVFEMESVIHASQAISDEIVLERLLDRLMQLALANAGAQRGALILSRQGHLHLEVEADLDAPVQPLASPPLEMCAARIPVGIINYVARTGEAVVLGNATTHPLFGREAYVVAQRPRSLLCMPIAYHGELTAVLYLEHRQGRDIFDHRRLETLRILAAQAAISIENAKLYESLQQSEAAYRSLFENAIEGIFRVAQTGRCISANPALAQMLGYATAEEFLANVVDVGRECFADQDDMHRFLVELNRLGRLNNFETRWRCRDGRLIDVSISARRVRDADGLFQYVEGSLTDISERKEKEQAELARRKAEGANQAKSLFLATMSHEIRTPLNGILGMAQLMLRDNLPQAQHERVQAIHRSGQHLLSILNDVLDFSKIEAGELALTRQVFALSDVFDALRQSVAPLVAERGLRLEFQFAADLPDALLGDRRALTQILLNLVTNAIKFTERGSIIVRCQRAAEVDDPSSIPAAEAGVKLRFEVEDSGIGIAPEAQQRIFAHFTQADGSITRRYGGTGLGLAICRRLVELQDGHIGVRSALGEGSVFWFELHYPEAEQVPGTQQAPVTTPVALNILLVEDVEINRQVTCGLLESQGHQVTVAENAATALAFHHLHPYDVVLMDIHLPDMSGVDAIRLMRAHHDPSRAATHVIALTASVTASEVASYLAAGIDQVVGKPIRFEELERALAQVKRPESAPESASQSSLAPAAAPSAWPVACLDSAILAQHLSMLGAARFAQLVRGLPAQFAAMIAELQAADSEAARRSVLHQLCGSAGNYGLAALAAQAEGELQGTRAPLTAEGWQALLEDSFAALAAQDAALAEALAAA